MKLSFVSLARLFLIGSICSSATAQPSTDARLVKPQFTIQEVEQIGKAMYFQDALAARASDILVREQSKFPARPISGWVTAFDDTDQLVIFVTATADRVVPTFLVRPLAQVNRQFEAVDSLNLSESLVSQFFARKLAISSITSPCSNRYNTIALVEKATGNHIVWAIAASIDPNDIVIGGHIRFTIDPSGRRVISTDKLSASCLVMRKDDPMLPKGATLSGLNVSHVVSQQPVETHVFTNYLYKIDMSIVTPDGKMWLLQQGVFSGPPIQVIEPPAPARNGQ
jgi:hypothetical protein